MPPRHGVEKTFIDTYKKGNMSYDLNNHFPFGPPEGFEEVGHTFKAWQPANDEARREWVVQAFKDVPGHEPELVKEITVPMHHTNIFGPDVEDVFALELATDAMIVDLGGDTRVEVIEPRG
jgi:hypothetical protein